MNASQLHHISAIIASFAHQICIIECASLLSCAHQGSLDPLKLGQSVLDLSELHFRPLNP